MKLCNYCHARQNLWWLQYRRGNLCYGTAAMRGKTCGNDKLRLQNKCGELCNCCHKREKPAAAAIYKRGKLCNCCHAREKTCGGYNKSVVNYATAAMRGKPSGGCNTNAGIYAMELLPCAEKPVAVAIWGCNTCAGNYATAVISGKTCGGCNIQARETMQLLSCAGKPVAATIQAW